MAQRDTLTRPHAPLMLFPDHPEWSTQTLRLLAEARYGGADHSEVHRTALALDARTWQAWADAWSGLASEIFREAEADEQAGRNVSARDRYLRAANYFRHAEFYVPPSEPLKGKLYDSCRVAFQRAIPHLSPRVEEIEVPYEATVLDGYLCHPSSSTAGPHPAVIFLGGADSLAEELYYLGGAALAQRDIYAVLVDTPGRGSALRKRGLHSRPDYEVPVRAVYQWLVDHPAIDQDRVALWGLSLGGYYAPRAAGHMPEIKALSCWCACYDVLEDLYEFYEGLQPIVQWLTGAGSDAEARALLREFTLAGSASQIRCPVQIVHAEGDRLISVAAAHKLAEAVAGDVERHIQSVEDGGAIHCNWDYYAEVLPLMADWLGDQLGRWRTAPR